MADCSRRNSIPRTDPIRIEEIRRRFVGKRLGGKISYFERVDSTNQRAYARAQEAEAAGEIFIAEEQTAGRGRLGRKWESPANVNLYLSAIVKPRINAADLPLLTLTSAVAVAEVLGSFAAVPPEVKWPNDVLIAGKKIAGILTESACEADRLLFAIVGIGVNLNLSLESTPEAIRRTATSLLTVNGAPVDRTLFACRLIEGLDRCYGELEQQGFVGLAERWTRLFSLRGKMVKVDGGGRSIYGTALGIDRDGALILEDQSGGRARALAGDVIPLDG
jgi:BirA family biotin operon repressor/biotin-[acetyl-CoA-carboxylase] ligase